MECTGDFTDFKIFFGENRLKWKDTSSRKQILEKLTLCQLKKVCLGTTKFIYLLKLKKIIRGGGGGYNTVQAHLNKASMLSVRCSTAFSWENVSNVNLPWYRPMPLLPTPPNGSVGTENTQY